MQPVACILLLLQEVRCPRLIQYKSHRSLLRVFLVHFPYYIALMQDIKATMSDLAFLAVD